MLETPSVPLAREIDPFRMAEFVAHEIEVPVTGRSYRCQPDEFVQGNAPVDRQIPGTCVHGIVHILVDQAEYDGLVTHERLVVAFRIADRLFVSTFVREFIPNLTRAPLFVRLLLYPFDPMVGDAHGHPEIESDTTCIEGGGQSCHPADILRDRNRRRLDLPDQHIGQSEIGHSVFIDSLVEIQGVIPEILSKTVVPIDHAGYPVEAEAVQVVLFQPELAVGEEEPHDFVFTVIEAPGAPCRMMALRPLIEIQVVPAVEKAQAFSLVVNAVGMDYIHNDRDAHPMSCIHQLFELFRSSEARAEGEEVRHLIAEGTVIRVLLKGHDLYRVISQVLDPGQYILPELVEGGDLRLLRTHSDMALVNQGVRPFQHLVMLPLIGLGRVPDLGAENLGLRVLDKPGTIGRYPFSSASGPFDEQLVKVPMAQEQTVQFQLPVAFACDLELISRGPLPVVELTDKVYPGGIGSPFPDYPGAVRLLVEAIIQMVVYPFRQKTSSGPRDPLPCRQYPLMPGFYRLLERLQVRVGFEYLFGFPHSFTRYKLFCDYVLLGSGFV